MSAHTGLAPPMRRAAARPRIRNGWLQGLAALTVCGALLRFSTLDTQSYWYDEAITVELVRQPFRAMLDAVPQSESTPPLYYVLAWVWSRIFGEGETGLRSFSAVVGTATVPVTYVAARQFLSQRSAFVAAALVAVSPFLVWYSQEARAYALLVLLGALSLVPLRGAVGPRPVGPLTAWAIAASLALATHYFAFFLVAAEAVWLLYRAPATRAAAKAITGVAVVGVALAGLAAYQARYGEHTAWISRSGDLQGRAAYLVHQLVVGEYPATHIRPLLVAVPIVVLVGLFAWTADRERAGALLALVFGLGAVVPPAALAIVGDAFFDGRGDYFIYRNLVVSAIPLTIAAAAVFATPRTGRLGFGAVAVTCVLLAAVSIEIARRPDLQKPDLREVAAELGARPTPRAIVADVRTAPVLQLYLARAVDAPKAGVSVPEVDLVVEPGSSPAPVPPRGFRRVEMARIDTFTIVRLLAERSRLVTLPNLEHQLRGSTEYAVLLVPRS